MNKTMITVSTIINAPVEKVWDYWTKPEHITQWNQASPDWHCPIATNDLMPEGKFVWRMEAKDGSFGFDFSGKYLEIAPQERIKSVMDDGRTIEISFEPQANGVKVTEVFEAESTNPIEMQQAGWQAILNNFKAYTESR
ncbi:MAG: SRPBCC family protein [Chitinophagales bacterium]|nr:SRPBCC family protein [Chitinophagales bacterium]